MLIRLFPHICANILYFALLATISNGATIRETQGDLIAWVDTQKAIFETEAEWASEKIIVEDLINLLQTEKENLTIKIEKLETTANATDNLRTKLNADKESLLASTKKLKSVIPNLENQVKDLLGKLPNALVEEINPLVLRLPEDSVSTRISLSERLLTVVGILNKIDKFNTGITLTSEIRSIGDKSLEVKTLYYGLAGAYFASESAGYSGVGTPGTEGWLWSEQPELSKKIINLIEVYEGTKEATFVELPVFAN